MHGMRGRGDPHWANSNLGGMISIWCNLAETNTLSTAHTQCHYGCSIHVLLLWNWNPTHSVRYQCHCYPAQCGRWKAGQCYHHVAVGIRSFDVGVLSGSAAGR